jgi:putative ABC transport system ATP-binding protein
MGPSGAGKTTVLRILAGLEPFHTGAVEVEDLALNGGVGITPTMLRALRRKVGIVFQFHHLFDHLTAIKNVWLAPVHAYGVPPHEAEHRARELLAALGVEHRAGALPRELSGGEAQRVAIARALANRPRIILADEPTAALDSERAGIVMDLLRQLAAEQQAAIIAVTHDEKIIGRFDRIFRLRDGQLVSTTPKTPAHASAIEGEG